MRLLCINNYSLEQDSSKFTRPSQHCWGIDYFRTKGHQVDTLIYNGYSSNRFKNLLNRIVFNVKLLFLAKKYDVIISYYSPIVDFLGIFKSLRLTKIRLYTFVHHYGKSWQVNKSFQKVFFISKPVMRLYKNKGINSSFVEWGPDVEFYDHYKKHITQEKPLSFVSNGRTNRDISIIREACKLTETSLTVIENDKLTIDDKIIIQRKKHGGLLIDRPTMLSYMNETHVSFISVKKDFSKDGLCGLNSFIEAAVLGQPIIMSDNTNIEVDIEKQKMGFVYKAGDIDDLICKINMFKSDKSLVKEYGKNARNYALEHSYENFCKQLYREIFINND